MQNLLRLTRVIELTGLKKSQIFDAVQRGIFPKPLKILEDGRAIAWVETEIAAYISGRIAARDDPTVKPRKRLTGV
jgi:prophage regulatory protein